MTSCAWPGRTTLPRGGAGVIMRGGSFAICAAAGVVAVGRDDLPTDALLLLGFRAAR